MPLTTSSSPVSPHPVPRTVGNSSSRGDFLRPRVASQNSNSGTNGNIRRRAVMTQSQAVPVIRPAAHVEHPDFRQKRQFRSPAAFVTVTSPRRTRVATCCAKADKMATRNRAAYAIYAVYAVYAVFIPSGAPHPAARVRQSRLLLALRGKPATR